MGAASSSSNDCKGDDCLTKAGTYKAKYLKARWADTDRAGYRYSVGYAPTNASTCRQCKAKIARGVLRVGRSTPSPFDAEGGHADMTMFYHADHAFDAFARSKCTSRVPLSTKDLRGFAELVPRDKARVTSQTAAFAERWHRKCAH